jgi:formylglycine-generating enzyme required for sulfatase activity
LIDENDAYMITDFGISTKARSTLRKSVGHATGGGTLDYMGPERFSKNNAPVKASDIWALGATLFELLTGDTPFGEHGGLLLQGGAEIPEIRGAWSNDLKAIVLRCLQKEPWERPTAGQLVEWTGQHARGEKISFEKTRIKARKPGKPTRRWKSFLVTVTCAAVLVVAGVFAYHEVQEKKTEIAQITQKADRLAREKAAAEERLAWEKAAADRAEADRMARERAEAERIARERAEADRVARERAEAERMAREKAEAERIARERDGNLEMVLVQGGTFTMGCTPEQGSDCYNDEKPAHRVTVSSFYIGKYEVTQAQWKIVMGNNPSKFTGDNLPVEQVSWDDVQEFIRKLNARTGLRYRLPTEAEWEYAARGGNRSRGYKYSGSNNISAVAWYDGNSGNKTHPVGQKQPNELGLYDMSGNVWEWCNDWKGDYSSYAQTNPTGPSSGSFRMYRGGSWLSLARYARVPFRGNGAPGPKSSNLGFRLARSSP